MALSTPRAKRLDGKVAIVTGAASGLGRSICLLFATHGARLVCADLRPTIDLERSGGDSEPATHELIQQQGGQAIFVKGDVTQSDQVAAVVAKAVEEFGQLDMLVHTTYLGNSCEENEDP